MLKCFPSLFMVSEFIYMIDLAFSIVSTNTHSLWRRCQRTIYFWHQRLSPLLVEITAPGFCGCSSKIEIVCNPFLCVLVSSLYFKKRYYLSLRFYLIDSQKRANRWQTRDQFDSNHVAFCWTIASSSFHTLQHLHSLYSILKYATPNHRLYLPMMLLSDHTVLTSPLLDVDFDESKETNQIWEWSRYSWEWHQ